MRKSIGVLAVIVILCLSGTALAHGGHGRGRGDRPFDGEKFRRPGPAFEQRDNRREQFDRRDQRWGQFGRVHDGLRVNMPQTIQNKIAESRRLVDDMRAEMRKTPFNRTRVLQLRERSLRLRREVSDWLFTQRLDAIEKAQRDKRALDKSPK